MATKADMIFNTFLPMSTEAEKEQGLITPIGDEIELRLFKEALEKSGLLLKDRRLKEMNEWIKNWNEENISRVGVVVEYSEVAQGLS